MKYVQINAYATAWAKSVILGKHRQLLAEGHESYFFWGRRGGIEDDRCKRFATDLDNYVDAFLTRIDGKPCFHSKRATRRLLNWLNEIDPDVVHLHNLLGYYINIELLFTWLANQRCKVVWTLHDCSPFTGHCIYFTYVNCMQWKTCCACNRPCPQPDAYPETYRRGMECWNFEKKRQLFTMLPTERVTLVTPSHWLEGLVKESFLAKYPVEVHHNTVDTSIFKPTPSDFRERYGIGDRFMVLGIASKWSERKGLGDFVRLAQELDPEKYTIVLAGLSRRQAKALPGGIVALMRIDSPQELAATYTAADVFFNPTLEDNYPTVNLEAEACGTPVVTYDTGGCSETVRSGNSKVVDGYDEALAYLSKASAGVCCDAKECH